MSGIKIVGNSSGTGTFTISSPNSNTSRTLTLPDEAGTVRVDSATPLPIFHAWRSSDYSIGTSPAILIYNQTKVNQGSHYNTTTGKFTAPVDGIYEFAWASIASNADDVYRYSLAINGTIESAKDELRIDSRATGTADFGSNAEFSRYIELSANDTVEVQVNAGTATTGYGNASYAYTYFRGRLIN